MRGSIPWLAFAAALFLSSLGVKVALPQKAAIDLSFSSPDQLLGIKDLLISTRQAVYDSYLPKHPNVISHSFDGDRAETVVVRFAGRDHILPEPVLHMIRGQLLRSRIPDEQLVIASLQKIRPSHLEFNPHLFQYGNIFIYFVGLALFIGSKAGLLPLSSDIGVYLKNPQYSAMIYAFPKYVICLLFALSTLLFFSIASRILRRRAAEAATLFYAVAPIFILENHVLKPYTFCLLPLLMGIRHALEIEAAEGIRPYLRAGFWLGLAAGSLWLSGYAALSVAVAHWIKPAQSRRIAHLWGAATAFVAAFFLANPYWLFAPREAVYELLSVAARAGDPLWPYSFLKLFKYTLIRGPEALGWPLWVAFIFGTAVAVHGKEKRRLIVLAPCLMYLLFTSNKHHAIPHYAVPMFPLCVIIAGFSLEKLIDRGSARRHLAPAVLAAMIGWTAAESAHYASLFMAKDPRYEAGAWINRNIPPRAPIAVSQTSNCLPVFRILDYDLRIIDSPDQIEPGDYYLRCRTESDGETLPKRLVLSGSFKRESRLRAVFGDRISWLDWLGERVEIYKAIKISA